LIGLGFSTVYDIRKMTKPAVDESYEYNYRDLYLENDIGQAGDVAGNADDNLFFDLTYSQVIF
jgi:hypothetical protein